MMATESDRGVPRAGDALPVVPNAAGNLAISPTDVAQFIRLDQCRRYLRLSLHQRSANRNFLRDYGVAPQSIPPLLTRSGAEFERRVERTVAARFPVVNLAAERKPRSGWTDDNARVVEEAAGSIRGGESIAAPLKRSGRFPPIVTHMIAIGERSGAPPPGAATS